MKPLSRVIALVADGGDLEATTAGKPPRYGGLAVIDRVSLQDPPLPSSPRQPAPKASRFADDP